eukprot:GFKZ01009035.1.p1 GENE.GFKZ01009035.1~~GFKZ01009035.1.p1  ORF type:complete len:797 (-),score=149.00 GFKZ01009035.1:3145-5535(-)
MTSNKRPPSLKERKAITVVTEALRTGSLHRGDIPTTADLLSRTLPELSRLPQHVIRTIAKTAMKHALRAVPADPSIASPEPVPQSPSVPKTPESQSVPRPDSQLANSNDLLPSVRPRTPQSASARKRRRTVTTSAEEPPKTTSFASYLVPRPHERLEDVGGMADVLQMVRELIEWPLTYGSLYSHLGVTPPRGILLHGPPGCGKSFLAHAIAGEFGVSFLKLSGPEVVSGVSGDSERALRALFEEAVRVAPSIVFVDQVDAIGARRDGASREMERRIVAQLMSCLDGLRGNQGREEENGESKGDGQRDRDLKGRAEENVDEPAEGQEGGSGNKRKGAVIVIAATSRPESLEPDLRRAGRLDKEIEVGAPDVNGRAAILKKLCRDLKMNGDVDVGYLAQRTAGYVGADLDLLVKEAGMACVRRFLSEKEVCDESATEKPGSEGENVEMAVVCGDVEDCGAEVEDRLQKGGTMNKELEGWGIERVDFEWGLGTIQPSALREGFATRPNITWDDVGSLEGVRSDLMMSIVAPIRQPELFSSFGLRAPAGVLLYGPPGCGKTLLARAVAGESGANFISVKGPELFSRYVGDSELAVRRVFARARSSAPCVIFFDELDALAPRRRGEGSVAGQRVVNMLLTEMDGFTERRGVFVVAATNRPDIIDGAMLRPGRLDKLVYVGMPDGEGRVSILRTLMKGVRLGADVDMGKIGTLCEGFSGADLQALIRGAGEEALREVLMEKRECTEGIEMKHFERAMESVGPSVSEKDVRMYRAMAKMMKKGGQGVKRESGMTEMIDVAEG